MERKTINIVEIDRQSPLYHDALKLRYDYFFRKHDLPFNILFDDKETVSRHFVLLFNKQLAAYGRLTDIGQGVFFISQMLTKVEFRRQKLGTALLEEIIAVAILSKAESIYLNARKDYVTFYKQAGFTLSGQPFFSKITGISHLPMEMVIGFRKK